MMKGCMLLLLLAALVGCGHSQSTKVGLMSFGDLEGKTLPDQVGGQFLSGQACGHNYRLSDAVRDALKGTDYDTLVDADVINQTGTFVWSNCFIVSGYALNSKAVVVSGGVK